MHIAVFCSNYPPHTGGLEVVARSIAVGLARRHTVTVITSGWDEVGGMATEDGVVVHRLPAIHRTEQWGVPYPVPLGPGIRAAMAAVRGVDVVHAHGALYPSSILARLSLSPRTAFVVTEHVGFVPYGSLALNALQRLAWAVIGDWTISRSDGLAVVNQRVGSWLQTRCGDPQVRIIANGVETGTFGPGDAAARSGLRRRLGLPTHGPLVLFVGRAVAKKNVDEVLALPRRNFSLVICGANRGLRSRGVLDLGVVPYGAMPDLYRACDLMIMPSVGEGFPVAAQEAMAAGLPLVLRWDPGYTGVVSERAVAAYREPGELALLVEAVLASPARREMLSAAGRQWALERWSWEAAVGAYEELFLSAIDRRRAGA